jgi:RimJ/RimL family protein N-acetyltransferase
MAAIEPKQVQLRNHVTVCICTPQEQDAPAVIDYLKAVFADDRYFMTTAAEAEEWQTPEKEASIIAENFKDPDKLMLVGRTDDKIVSFSDVWVGPRRRNRHVGQLGISILPEFRGLGLGTAIMQTLIDWAAAHPVIEKLALGVWAKNAPAVALYEKMGFIEEGRKVREVKYTDGSYDDCICMYRHV